ncbi:MAG: hypothetical protein JW981_02965 [Anaerolineae bacterium]|nr:hypothetical protein [Anaerolineae bacterium]
MKSLDNSNRKNHKSPDVPKSPGSTGVNAAALLESMLAFINAESWVASRRIVERHPELLTDEADVLLTRLIERQSDPRVVVLLEDHRGVLATCRIEGIEIAFRGRITPSVLPVADHNLLARLQSADSMESLMALARTHPEVLPVVQEVIAQVLDQDQVSLMTAIEAFLAAESRDAAQQVVASHPVLLSDEANVSLAEYAQFIESQGDPYAIRALAERRWLLAQCQASVAQHAMV